MPFAWGCKDGWNCCSSGGCSVHTYVELITNHVLGLKPSSSLCMLHCAFLEGHKANVAISFENAFPQTSRRQPSPRTQSSDKTYSS